MLAEKEVLVEKVREVAELCRQLPLGGHLKEENEFLDKHTPNQ